MRKKKLKITKIYNMTKMSKPVVYTLKTLDLNKIDFSAVKANKYGGRKLFVNYMGKSLFLQLPQLSLPFGINKPDGKYAGAGYSMELSVGNNDSVVKFLEFLDNKLLEEGEKNSKEWFKKTLKKDTLKELFLNSNLKYSKDEKGNLNKDYPARLKVKLPVNEEDGTVNIKVFNKDTKEKMELTVENLETVLYKGCQMTVIVKPTSVYLMDKGYGVTWYADQILISPKVTKLEEFSFVEGGEEEEVEEVEEEVVEEVEEVVEEEDALEPEPEPKKTVAKGKKK